MPDIRRLLPLIVAAMCTAAADAATVRFVAFGDAGTGSPVQYAVGAAMAQVCSDRGCDFAVALGDNFYPSGVTSVNDPQWVTKFERPYARLGVPVHAVLGNHDNGTESGEGDNNARGDVQVRYHFHSDPFTGLWRMPGRYYSFTAPLDATIPLAEFFALDSSPLAAGRLDPDPRWERGAYQAKHAAWLDAAIGGSRARWKIAFAHFPFPHREGGTYRPFLEDSVCGKVDLFLAGHHHHLRWLKPLPACGRTHFLISGAAAAPRPLEQGAGDRAFWERGDVPGFFWVELQADRYTAAAYTLDGEMRLEKAFELTVTKP